MIRFARGLLLAGVLAIVVTGSLPNVARADLFSSVQWAGHEATSEALQGKTVVVLGFVTWCPICNGVAPKLLDQIKSASAGKPIVVLAIATDVDASQAKTYMVQRKFTGPNILYGSDRTLCGELGLESKALWNFVLIGPDGRVKDKEAATSHYEEGPDAGLFVAAIAIKSDKNLGVLKFASDSMSPDMQKFAWAAETGDLSQLALLSQPSSVHGLGKDEIDQLLAMRSKVLDQDLKSVKRHFIGDVPDRIGAYEMANKLSRNFPDAPQGKVAAKVASLLSSDPNFHKEISAKNLFNQAIMKSGSDGEQLKKLLAVVADRYPGTWYGDHAREAIDSARNDSSGGTAKKSAAASN